MHWGIRRFQPYGVGYQRIGGKTGKEQIRAARHTGKSNPSGLTDKQIDNYVRNAQKSDKYDLGFLEKIQNYSPAPGEKGGMTKQQRLKEYKEYLQDPDKYWKKDLSKKYKEIYW